MPRLASCLLLCVGALWCQYTAHVQAEAGATRRLLEEGVTGVRVADFSTLPKAIVAGEEYDVGELQLMGQLDVSDSSASGGSSLPGAYQLGPTHVQGLAQVVWAELDPIEPADAVKAPAIEFPGAVVRGESVLDTLSTSQPLRVPTVFAPFHAGTKFTLQGRDTPPGTTLTFSNMTLLLPNVTYEGVFDSGFLSFFDLGASSRVCFTNSILALRSCKGFTPEKYHMWCCTARQCNILYTRQALQDLGFAEIGGLDFLQCSEGAEATAGGPDADPIVQEADTTGVRVANFSGVPANLSQAGHAVSEVQLPGEVSIGGSIGMPALYGTFFLGPDEVMLLDRAVSANQAPIAAVDAATAPVAFPGGTIRGESVLDTLSVSQPLRIPTVFAPFHAGTVFSLEARDVPPGTSLTFSNMTLLLPNVTYESIYESGFTDFFDMAGSARVCFTNSILALQSCEGFAPNKFHMWCCTELQCNILYTKQGLEDLGFSTADIGALDVIQCYSAEQSPSTSAASPSVGTGGTHPDGEAASIAPDLSAAPARGRAVRAVHAALWAGLAVLASTARLL